MSGRSAAAPGQAAGRREDESTSGAQEEGVAAETDTQRPRPGEPERTEDAPPARTGAPEPVGAEPPPGPATLGRARMQAERDAGARDGDERGGTPALPGSGVPFERALDAVRAAVERGTATLVLPSEVFLHFYPASPEQVINACRAAGFRDIHFEVVGDELVALEYLRIWRENRDKRTWIRSTHPLVVEYCRARHPELLPLLAPVTTPAVALARYLTLREPGIELIYAGLDAPGGDDDGGYAATIAFVQLEQLLKERKATPGDQPHVLRALPPERQRYLSTPGGLPLPMLDQERVSSRHFRKLRGLHTLAGLSRLLREGEDRLGFIDILPFDGWLDHPALGPPDELLWRRSIMELAEPQRAEHPVVVPPPELDLSASYGPRPSTLPEEAMREAERVLAEVGASVNGSYWRRDPRAYASYLSLAESLVRTRPEAALGLFQMSRTYAQAVRDATHDALTDLYSYRALMERVEEELGQANRAGSTLAILFVDLDTFKEINDEYGHPVGNEVLRRVARVLAETVRSTDIAGRFGGDEFVALLVNSDPQGAVRVAEQIRQRVEEIRVPVSDGEARTTCSVGIAYHSGTERSLLSTDDLFAEADASLYIAKAHGGNRVHPVVREELSR